MQIQLKQREIEAGIRMFVVAQGINLGNKTVEIDFTAGRNGSGITALIDLEEIGVAQEPFIPSKALRMVDDPIQVVPAQYIPNQPELPKASQVHDAGEDPLVTLTASSELPVVKSSQSLFG